MYSKVLKLLMHPEPKYGILKSLFYIFLSCSFSLLIFLISPYNHLPFTNNGIIQKIHLIYEFPSEELPPIFFSELLALNQDTGQSIKTFNTKIATEKLLITQMFRYIKIKKNFNNRSLIIEYSLKQPIAFFGNKTFHIIDESGHVFPALPLFLSRKLPEIFIPEKEEKPSMIGSKYLKISKHIIEHLRPECVRYINLSGINDYPYEIIISLREGSIIQLTTFDMESQLITYQRLEQHFQSSIGYAHPLIYDLRFRNSALISHHNPSQ